MKSGDLFCHEKLSREYATTHDKKYADGRIGTIS
ncbi:hypothetical protein DM47_3287 [Burkholderia mallei]|nr:hypothetical protein DM47_3287 [Burkholderia mallei]